MSRSFVDHVPELARRLRGVGLFADLGDAELEAVAARVEVHRCPPDRQVIRHGDTSNEVYFVLDGHLRATVFSLGGLINAIFAKNFDQVNWIPSFVLTPLTYFGGVFYSVDLLPEWARTISMANPILHMVNAFRYGFLGTSDVNLGGAFTITIVLAVGLFALAVILLNRGSGTRD